MDKSDELTLKLVLSGIAKEMFEQSMNDTGLSAEEFMLECLAITNLVLAETKKGKNLYPIPIVERNTGKFINTHGLKNVRNEYAV